MGKDLKAGNRRLFSRRHLLWPAVRHQQVCRAPSSDGRPRPATASWVYREIGRRLQKKLSRPRPLRWRPSLHAPHCRRAAASFARTAYEAIWGSTSMAAPYSIHRRATTIPIILFPDSFGWLATRRPRLRIEAPWRPSAGARALNIGEIRATRGSSHKVDRPFVRPSSCLSRSGRDSRRPPPVKCSTLTRPSVSIPPTPARELEVVDDCVLFFVQLPKFDYEIRRAA